MIKYYDILDKNIENNILPRRYFINSKGYLYNCLGKNSHREANLLSLYKIIEKCILDNNYEHLNNLLINELKTYKRIINKGITKEDVFNYLNINIEDINNSIFFDLVIGTITSKIILLERFIELKNITNNPIDGLKKINDVSKNDIRDILIGFCGFHKIESNIEKTITTSSYNLEEFDNYFKNNWHVNIMPKINIKNNDDKYLIYQSNIIEFFLDKNPNYVDKVSLSGGLVLYK